MSKPTTSAHWLSRRLIEECHGGEATERKIIKQPEGLGGYVRIALTEEGTLSVSTTALWIHTLKNLEIYQGELEIAKHLLKRQEEETRKNA